MDQPLCDVFGLAIKNGWIARVIDSSLTGCPRFESMRSMIFHIRVEVPLVDSGNLQFVFFAMTLHPSVASNRNNPRL